MHQQDAAQLRKLWGDHPCDHQELADEQQDDGFLTGNIVCTLCGRSFPDAFTLEQQRARQRPSSAPPMPRGSETILVVEDEPAIQRAMKRALEAAGYATLIASDGEKAFSTALAHRSEIDLVITDLVMPLRGGYWLLDALKEEGMPTKILVVTGYSDLTGDMDLDRDTPVLGKPWTIPELLVKVRQTLDAPKAEAG